LAESIAEAREKEAKLPGALAALEGGNSPQMIFQHYRELATEDEAKAWLAITPAASKPVRERIEKERAAKIVAFPAKAAA